MRIERKHIDALKEYLGEENLRYFRHLKGLTGEVFPVLRLNTKKGIPYYPVGHREGRQIRNWMRLSFWEFRTLDQNTIEKLAEKLVNKAILI